MGLPVLAAPANDVQDNAAIGGAPGALRDALQAAATFARAETSPNTRLAYRSDFADFAGWCEGVEQSSMPASPAIVSAYLSSLSGRGLKASTIARRVAAIRYCHRRQGHESPTSHEIVRAVHRGIRNTIGTRKAPKAPATAQAVRLMLKRIPDTLAGRRDRALLLMGFAGALRRSELVALDVGDIRRIPGGVEVLIRRSKTDQEGSGQTIGIPDGTKLRPVAALFDWLDAAGITSGPIFRRIRQGDRLLADRLTDKTVADLVKKYAKAAKLDPAQFAGHSLRAGFITSALESGADVFAAADQARHRKLETTREYDRRAKLLKNNAGRGFL